jgi:hypothetical protein
MGFPTNGMDISTNCLTLSLKHFNCWAPILGMDHGVGVGGEVSEQAIWRLSFKIFDSKIEGRLGLVELGTLTEGEGSVQLASPLR